MVEFIQEMFKTIFGDNIVFATFLISMMPLIELRGAIPFGMSKDIWGNLALSSWKSFGLSLLGSCLVVPILALVLKPVLNWLKKTKLFKKLVLWFENLISKKSASINNKINDLGSENVQTINKENINNQTINDANINNQNVKLEEIKTDNKTKFNKQYWIKFFGVLAFVSIPFPLTGVWMGTAIAVMLNLDFVSCCISVIIGNIIAGLIMMTLCAIFPNFTIYILLIFIVLTIILIIANLIKSKIQKSTNKT